MDLTQGGDNRGHTSRRLVQGVPQVELVWVSSGNFFKFLSHQDIRLCLQKQHHEQSPSRDFLLIAQIEHMG